MRNTILSYLFLPLFAGMSMTTLAATAPSEKTGEIVLPSHHAATQEKLNLNQADAASLKEKLSGVGAAKAEAITAYRETHGPFTSVDELLEVKGIGSALLERNRDRLMVD
ncbi:ComEA family DNA-binding protein [Pseudomonas sp. MH2]|uniref:ComEA family DNA-binding protein n=1 Tax=Pseudomonas machongensis TaxID=3110229 RepID=A0ABU5V8Z3_9PSED|nr:ComEA family DNA-binding protein [Pseudomonas sp. MH2]MEA5669835.1 ComEA family DNA-binding protein [Pseudomonas sp. MH2]